MTTTTLASKKCLPCQGGIPPLPLNEILKLKRELHQDWQLVDHNTRLHREITFKDFAVPMGLAQRIAQVAQEQWHHPVLTIGWGQLKIKIWDS